MGMYHCRKGWGKGVATWGNHLLAIFLGLNITVPVLPFLIAQDFYKNFGHVWVGAMGSFVFSGEVLLTFEGRPRPLLDSLRFELLNEEFIGFTFVSVVSFPSCYYISIVGVVRVRTILTLLERQLLI